MRLALALAAALAAAAPAHAETSARYGHAVLRLQHGELAFARSGAPRPLRVRVPAHAAGVALGLDARGRLVGLVDGRGGIHRVPLSGAGALRRVPATRDGDDHPSVFRGRLAFDRGTGVFAGSLDGAARLVWRGGEWAPADTAIGAGGAVAFVARRDGSGNGAWELATPSKRLLSLPLGDIHTGSLAIDGVDASGRRVTVTRRFDDDLSHVSFSL